jgi:hypothetical protein
VAVVSPTLAPIIPEELLYRPTPGRPVVTPPSTRSGSRDPRTRLASKRRRSPKAACPTCGLWGADTLEDPTDLDALAEWLGTDRVACMGHAGHGSRERWIVAVGALINEAPPRWALHRVAGELADNSGLVTRVVVLRRRTMRERLADTVDIRLRRSTYRRSETLADGGPARVELPNDADRWWRDTHPLRPWRLWWPGFGPGHGRR